MPTKFPCLPPSAHEPLWTFTQHAAPCRKAAVFLQFSFLIPPHRYPLHQPRQRHPLRLTPAQDRLDHLRRRQRQPQYAGHIGRVYLLRPRKLVDRGEIARFQHAPPPERPGHGLDEGDILPGFQRQTFYRWYDRYLTGGPEALADKPTRPDRVWNRIPDAVQGRIIDLALEVPELSPRELAVRFTDQESYFVSEASVYRLLKSHDLLPSPAFIQIKGTPEFHTKTTAPNQLWQTDFTYLKVIGWGWFYLCTVLDDFSRYVIVWPLCTGMTASDVSETLELATTASGCRDLPLRQRPRLLSDNGPGFISDAFARWMAQQGIQHVRGAPAHPQTQGKIKRWHQTMKNRILLENYYLPGALQAEIETFVERYNHQRYHDRLSNLTPADVYFGRGQTILLERERIKRRTIQHRRLMHHQKAA
jgi:putative transposase